MALTYPVKWITNTMRGAPQISGTAGTFLAALDAFLNTGWGSANAISMSVSGGVGTAVFAEGVYFEDHAVVAIANVTTPSALNGEARVLTHTNNSITFETDAPDGAATTGGTITVRYAPVGNWSKPFTGTNKACFRSADVQSNGHYLRVDDAGTITARVASYENMTDVDTGTGPFPTAVQMSGGGYVHKSTAANATSVRYSLVADSRAVLWAVECGSGANALNRTSNIRGFGDCIAIASDGDPWSTFLSYNGSANTGTFHGGALSGGTASVLSNAGTVLARAKAGLGSAVLHDSVPASGAPLVISGQDTMFGAAPSNVTGKLYLSRMYLKPQVAADGLRALVPGAVYVPQSGLTSLANPQDTMAAGSGDLAGRMLLGVGCGANGAAAQTGIAFIDATGPWR